MSASEAFFVNTEYLSLLSVQGQFELMWCISNFDNYVSTFHLNFRQSLYCQVYTLPVFFNVAMTKQNVKAPGPLLKLPATLRQLHRMNPKWPLEL